MQQSRHWRGRWIWREGLPRTDNGNELVYFRRSFMVPETGCRLAVHVTADSRYRLYLNGRQVLIGPAKGDDHVHYYESADLSDYLLTGLNVLAICVLHYAPGGPLSGPTAIRRSPWGGFLLDGELQAPGGDEVESLATDEKWKCLKDESYRLGYESYMSAIWLGGIERIDGGLVPHGWQEAGYDDSAWQSAAAFMDTRSDFGILTPWQLEPRSIPPMFERETAFKGVKRSGGEGGPALERAAVSFFTDAGSDTPALVIEPLSRAWVELDAGELTTGFLRAEWTGGGGSCLRILCSECYEKPAAGNGRRGKGIRDDSSDGMELLGDSDQYIVSGRSQPEAPMRESYEPFWFRTFRYVRLEIETGAEPLHLHRFYYRETGYPLEAKTTFRCSDERLAPLWTISLNTLARSMHETYEDCPYYEQLQYTMDTRLEMLFHISVSADERLGRKAIRHFHNSRLPSGILQCRYPSAEPQVIPGFSVYWILMLHDHYLYFGDEDLLRECRATADGVLEWFHGRLTPEGLVGQSPPEYWAYVDWVENWPFGVPPAAQQGPAAVYSLMYIVALRKAAELMAWSGREGLSREYLEKAELVKEAVRELCWSPERRLFRDGPGVEQYSQHAQMWAVLAGVCVKEEAGQLMERTLADSSLAKASYSMAFFLFRALSEAGRYDLAYPLWKDWQRMVDLNMTTWAEDPVGQRSDCHGWGAVPLYEFPSEILGVKPSAPGYSAITIAPKPGELSWAQGSVATPRGMVETGWTIAEGVFRMTVEGPPGIPVLLTLPDGTQRHFQSAQGIAAECPMTDAVSPA